MARHRIDLEPPAAQDEAATERQPAIDADVAGPPESSPEQVLAETPDARDIAAELTAPPRRPLPWLTLALCGGVVAALAFTAGAWVQKGQGGGSAGGATGFARAGAAARAGAGSGSGVRTGGAGGGLTVGTVKLVDGSVIYLTDVQGDIVKVTTTGATQVSESVTGKVGDLRPGQTVSVRGSQGAGGDVAATSVVEGGLAGLGFGGGGGGGGSTGARGSAGTP